MTIDFRCSNPACGKTVHAPDGAAGRQGQCPRCGTVQTVPAPAAPSDPQTGPASADPPEKNAPGRLTLIRYALAERKGTIIALACILVVCGLAYAMFNLLSGEDEPSSKNVGHSYVRNLLSIKERAERIQSLSSLKALHTQLVIYGARNDGRFPDSLDQLVRDGLDPRALRVSPKSDQEFSYVRGLTDISPRTSIVVYAPEPARDGTRMVLLVNGSAETWPEKEFQARMAKQAQPKRPPTTAPSRPAPKR